jgi:hypothetical protein
MSVKFCKKFLLIFSTKTFYVLKLSLVWNKVFFENLGQKISAYRSVLKRSRGKREVVSNFLKEGITANLKGT